MSSLSVLAFMVAVASVASAAPQRRQQFTHKLGPAPFQGSLPTISGGVTPIDLDLSSYSAYGWPEDSDQFRCHGTCGILIRVSRTKEKCDHPYAEPFSSYCVGQCAKADPGSVYPPAKVFAKECKFDVDRPAREAPKEEENRPDSKNEKETTSVLASSQQLTTAASSNASAKDASPSTASFMSTASATPTTAGILSSTAPVGTSSIVSTTAPTGTGAPSAATPSAKTIVEVTNGASKSFDFTVAVGVAALAILAVC